MKVDGLEKVDGLDKVGGLELEGLYPDWTFFRANVNDRLRTIQVR